MRLLLPPSETKRPGGRGRPLRARTDTHPLHEARETVHAALARLLAGDRDTAARALLLPPAVAEAALVADVAVLDAPTTPALRRYAGVVYDGIGYDGLTGPERRLAERSTLIFSGLFGVLRGDEPVPDYRVPAKAVLPGVGVVATFWRPHLTPLLRDLARNHLIVDLRSSDYAAMWRPASAARERVVTVRVLSPLPRGGHGVISYPSKLAKGRLAAALVRRAAAGTAPAAAGDVAAAWIDCGGVDAEVTPAGLELYTG